MMREAAPVISERQRVRAMVVDDSAVVRGFIVRILESDPSIEVLATCSNGQTAIAQIARLKPDIVILDIEMPVMDGLTALPRILAAHPGTKIIMASTLTHKNAEISLEALARGATDYIPKPSARQLNGNGGFRRDLLQKIAVLSAHSHKRPGLAAAPLNLVRSAQPSLSLRSGLAADPRILAIGSSTGGPQALLTLLKMLPQELNAPVVIAQHMPATFTTVLAQHLARASGRTSSEAVHDEVILPGRIYLAPGDFHFEVVREGATVKARLSKAAPENFCRPSVNPLFRSVARAFGGQCVTVMLTGMGCDGLEGTREIASAGGAVIAQDEATSVVWGMPGAIANAGLCTAILPLPAIPNYLGTLFRQSAL
ncbi:MAG: chemotaxis response regulator protein-glutamate methylesterase [Rhizomicrobium sp.]|jgi:two-component system chemotaxis response regulator CheB